MPRSARLCIQDVRLPLVTDAETNAVNTMCSVRDTRTSSGAPPSTAVRAQPDSYGGYDTRPSSKVLKGWSHSMPDRLAAEDRFEITQVLARYGHVMDRRGVAA